MRIESVQVAIVYEKQDDILYLLGQGIVNFQAKFQTQKQLTNLQEPTPPEIPRLTILAPNFVVNIALSRIDIIATIPPNVSSNRGMSFSYVQNIVQEVQETLINGKIDYQWTGIVVNTGFSRKKEAKTPLEAVEPVYDKILNIPRRRRNLASFNLQIGFSEAPYYVNYVIAGYEKANITFDKPVMPGTVLDFSKGRKEVLDTGVSVNLDINNRLQTSNKNMSKDFRMIIKKCDSLLGSILEDLNLSDVLGL